MNQLRDRLAAANPVPDLRCYTREQVTATVSMILSDAAQADEAVTKHSTDEIPSARPRRRRRRLMVGLFAGLIVVPTAAFAVVSGMHTGFFAPEPPVGFGSMNEPGEEFLNSNDPEISTVVQGLTKEFPLPPGASYSLFLKRYPAKVNELVQRSGLSQDVAYYAHCAWYEHWLNGDAAQRAADQPTIDAIPTWKYWNWAVDDATGENPGLDWLNGIAAETRVGKTTKITQEIKVNCGYGPGMWEGTPAPSPRP